MKLVRIVTVQAISDVKNIKLSRKSKRKIKKAANHSVDAAVSVAADVLKSLRKQK
ncbi:MAG: hypothetical protein IJM51_02860 [Clostridia bacterium]|nr:hypothetical protein [Clostridia bacterium]